MLLFLPFLVLIVYGRRTDYSQSTLKLQITSLPGLDDNTLQKYTMFSGYVDVYPAHNRSLFWWFVESLNDPKHDPVALWTNGGPGCSGLGGMFSEQGPFRPNADLELYVNNYSWVNVANMLFIEAPAGVGFSFSEHTADYTTDDNTTAIDNYHLIRLWLEQFKNYQDNEFYITSESYGGHYMPTLAQQIELGNKAGGKPRVNLKGVFVGNPLTDPVENAKGMFDTWYGHQLVSYPAWQSWYDHCDDGAKSHPPYSVHCAQATRKLNEQISDTIDPYAMDYPVCTEGASGHSSALKVDERVWFMKQVIGGALKRPIPGMYADLVESADKLLNADFPPSDYYPCEGNWAQQWLNKKEVQQAIHANPAQWATCSDLVYYSSKSIATPMEPTWRWLVENAPHLRMTIVSGDDDSVCGTLGTQSWIWNMNYTVDDKVNWKKWMDSNGQLGGWMTKFKDAFNFITVHSAGHMVPEQKPMRSLEVFAMYLKGDI